VEPYRPLCPEEGLEGARSEALGVEENRVRLGVNVRWIELALEPLQHLRGRAAVEQRFEEVAVELVVEIHPDPVFAGEGPRPGGEAIARSIAGITPPHKLVDSCPSGQAREERQEETQARLSLLLAQPSQLAAAELFVERAAGMSR
jgi:hypothetical protein